MSKPSTQLSLDNVVERHVIVARNDELYEAFPDLCLLPSGKLFCLYRESDLHAANWTRTVLIESDDGGRTWKNKREISDLKFNLPRITRLSDGRLVINGDVGNTNYLFWSDDDGKTWSKPQRVSISGQCPDRIVELRDGALLCNAERRRGGEQTRVYRPAAQNLYQYRSADGGKTWQDAGLMFEDRIWGGCGEGATVEVIDGTLVCHIRNSAGYAYPSLKIISRDGGRTWSDYRLSGTFGGMHRAGLLRDGRMLITYRQMAGNSSLSAWCGDPMEEVGYCVPSRWGDDDGVLLIDGALRIRTTGDGSTFTMRETGHGDAVVDWKPDHAAVVPPVYFLPPPEFDDSIVTIDATLRVVRNDTGLASTINVTCAAEVLFYPDRVEVLGAPDASYQFDATRFHDYRIRRNADSLTIEVDGIERIRTNELVRTYGLHRDRVNWGQDRTTFGTTFRGWDHLDMEKWKGSIWRWDNFERAKQVGIGESYWKSLKITVDNQSTMDLSWSWDAASGTYPDQYQRDHVVEVDWDPQADFGGSDWVQFPDGEIFVAYFTAEETHHQRPYIKGCYLKPGDFRYPVG